MARQTIALTENFGDFLDARIRKIFDTEFEENIKESMISKLYNIMSTDKNFEVMSGLGALGDHQELDGQISYDGFSQLYDKTTYFPERCLGIKIERKLKDDDLTGKMDQRPVQLAISMARTREKSGGSPFNGAFTGTGGSDGVSLCNASHPYSPDDATPQSNAGTSAFSAVTVEATRRLAHTSILNDRGELANVNYDTILCSVTNEEKAWAIINSTGQVDTANNNRNFHSGRYNLAVWDRLTDSNNWFFIDSKLAKQFLIWWDRVKPELNYDRDFETYVAKWSSYARWAADYYDWRWIYGHNVT